ncbi:MAG TPA: hypothetical protein VHH12_16325, partial [Mycobacterium sp.]|nr:hypothetical protein [Mycobacterium sp.]
MRSAPVILGLSAVAVLAAFSLPGRRSQERASAESIVDATANRPAAAAWTRPEGPIRVALQAGHWKA